ncbi:MAG: excinuclease ABC subunit UvrA [Planctomycetia bacterium]|nr:excinuclease ABC subunit UvrA [Planctomycetia bacterium]
MTKEHDSDVSSYCVTPEHSSPASAARQGLSILVNGARTHNLKNVSVAIPQNRLTVFAGPSGSGKSSLAFDTLFAESQRQYLESLPTTSRYLLSRLERPDVDSVVNLMPTIALEQRQSEPNARSTVASITETYDLLRLLFARLGVAHCYQCGRAIQRQTLEQIAQSILRLPEGTRFMIMAPLPRTSHGDQSDVIRRLYRTMYTRARVDGKLVELTPDFHLEADRPHQIEPIIDRLTIREGLEPRLMEALNSAVEVSGGLINCLHELPRENQDLEDKRTRWADMLFSVSYSCHKCNVHYAELEPRTFSYQSPYGACPHCKGAGKIDAFVPELLIGDASKTIGDGALAITKGLLTGTQNKLTSLLKSFATLRPEAYATAVEKWSEEDYRFFMYGAQKDAEEDSYDFDEESTTDQDEDDSALETVTTSCFSGLIPLLDNALLKTKSTRESEFLESFHRLTLCQVCHGARIRREARSVTVGGEHIQDVCAMTVDQAATWFSGLSFNEYQSKIAKPILDRILATLVTMSELRLGYLTLDREASTLSCGELQRCRLANALSNKLSGVCYVLDEPSTGLHPRDTEALIRSIETLRRYGNTVVLVDHDEELVRLADYIVDLGPGAGVHGGEILAQGSPSELSSNPTSTTGRYLSGELGIAIPKKRRKFIKTRTLVMEGANAHNLKDVTLTIPLGLFVCVTGVSGSGKSTLILETLVPALKRRRHSSDTFEEPSQDRNYTSLRGAVGVDKVIVASQEPIGRTPRATPATYSGLYDEIRKLFSQTTDARVQGYKSSRFSFNVAEGRCEACQGVGYHRIETSILPDIYAVCPMCEGKRFNAKTLEVHYKGKSIADVLDMSFESAATFFENIPSMSRILNSFIEVGLGYLTLGQPSTTLSGGEAQRVKLATELARVETGKTLYVLDEPTIGLHPSDMEKLLAILNRLVDSGNTVVTIEHSLEVMKSADWIIDLGPEGGEKGGYILACGSPEEIASLSDNETGRFLRNALK